MNHDVDLSQSKCMLAINFMLRVSVRAMHKQRGKKKKQAYQLHGAWFSDNTFSEPWKANVASNLILLILDHIEKKNFNAHAWNSSTTEKVPPSKFKSEKQSLGESSHDGNFRGEPSVDSAF